ncbi:SDR family NAD(P)-dependent oxidoreductase [Streptomyces sp. BE147]|uniref:SDR family NAD(P)-dependent oxidoreductase n=1 Tax=unclassified Streptomyces TaxID=2593676 RepID=UPI002E774351|nr:SDR family NAD(P)-dependent oxidoreductase [Streptomyces sp. BE147]MEE1742585.1 SDR family NAD(P)-dependent oxidoreductase [Streptomyces sp. BE147]
MTTRAAVYPDLDGRSVCVTGAARGLGLAMAEAFVRAGCHVLLLDIDGAELDRVRPVLAARRPDRVIGTATAPVSDEDAVTAALADFTARTGELSVMVANAGVSANAPSLDLGLDRWNTALDVNLTGVFVCARAAARVMREGDGGVVLTTSSMYGVTAGPERAAYCATKAAVAALTKVLAVEWAPHDIRVNALAPGYVETDLLAGLSAAGRLDTEALRRRTPRGRLGSPEDIAHLALFLSSAVAANITGQVMVSDGGWTADGYAVAR